MYSSLIALIFGAIVGCVHFARTEEPLLPDTANLPCCWQVFEQLYIDFKGEQLALSSVTAFTDETLTVVILDPLGRRIFAVIQKGNDIKVKKSIQIQQDIPVKWLLIGVFLRNMPDSGWLFENSNWAVKRDVDHVLLMQDDRVIVRLTEPGVMGGIADTWPRQGFAAQIQYPDLKLEVNITTLLRQSL